MKTGYQLSEIRYEGTPSENGFFTIHYAGGMQVHFGKYLLVKTKEAAEMYCKEIVVSINMHDDLITNLKALYELCKEMAKAAGAKEHKSLKIEELIKQAEQ